ncbi:MAG: hypothetical protein ABIK47_02200 [candidate division WOR-3 bacterium]
MINNQGINRRSKIILRLTAVVLALGLLFLPGPNGLVSVLIKLYRARNYQLQIQKLKAKADSLEQEIRWWQNPAYATRVARQIFTHPDTVKTDTTK